MCFENPIMIILLNYVKIPSPGVGSPLVFFFSSVYLQHVRKRDRRFQRLNIQQGLVMLLQFCVKKQNVLHEKNRSGGTRQNRKIIDRLYIIIYHRLCFRFGPAICGISGWHNGGSRMEKKHAINMGHIMPNPSCAWS